MALISLQNVTVSINYQLIENMSWISVLCYEYNKIWFRSRFNIQFLTTFWFISGNFHITAGGKPVRLGKSTFTGQL